MEQLENKLRAKIIKILKIIVIVGAIIDISFFIMFYIKDSMLIPANTYAIRYVFLPILVNTITYFIANAFNKSDKYSDDHKKLVCSMSLCTLAGSMSVFHSCYPPLWVAPSITLLFCSVFHNKKIYKWMLIYSCILVVISCIYICTEGTLTVSYFVEQCIVAEAITIISGLVAREVSLHQLTVLDITTKSMQNEEAYRTRLEYDSLTKVHSREYMSEVAYKVFGTQDEKNYVGIAILDLDNFKNVNDKFGHDNGDKVLQELGSLLNENTTDNEAVGRFGGEEFVVIFKHYIPNESFNILDNIRKKLYRHKFDFMNENISFSAGLIKCKSTKLYEDAFKVADEALYISKETGKNKITFKEI